MLFLADLISETQGGWHKLFIGDTGYKEAELPISQRPTTRSCQVPTPMPPSPLPTGTLSQLCPISHDSADLHFAPEAANSTARMKCLGKPLQPEFALNLEGSFLLPKLNEQVRGRTLARDMLGIHHRSSTCSLLRTFLKLLQISVIGAVGQLSTPLYLSLPYISVLYSICAWAIGDTPCPHVDWIVQMCTGHLGILWYVFLCCRSPSPMSCTF